LFPELNDLDPASGQQPVSDLTCLTCTTSGWPPASNGDTNPRLCSACDSPFSTNIRLWDEASPESLTIRGPVAVTGACRFLAPCSFSLPLLRVSVTLVVLVRGTLISPLGRAVVTPPAKDHCRR